MNLLKSEKDTFRVEETIWGYIVRPGEAAMKRAAVGEIVALLCCVMFGVFAYCQWLLPNSINSMSMLPFKMLGTVAFFVPALLCYGIARRGLTIELQIDQQRAELREVYRNREGASYLVDKFDFHGVNSVFIKRNNSPFRSDVLYIDHRDNPRPLFAAKGDAGRLEAIKETLARDMRNETLTDLHRAQVRRQNPRRQLMASH